MKRTAVFLALAMLTSWGAFAVSYGLAVTVEPADTGYVQLDPSGGSYVAGTRVTLTPIPRAGYAFDHWEMDLSGHDVPAMLVMNGSRAVKAVFMSEQCALEDVKILSPRDGSVFKVGRESSDLPIILSAAANCIGDTKRVTFTVDGGWETIDLMPDQNGLYTITGPSVASLGYGPHILHVAATSKHQPEVVVEDFASFALEAAPAGVDDDTNGLPDNTFSALDMDGASWISAAVVPETLNRRLAIATRWEAPVEGASDAGPIVLSIKNPARPAQIVTVSVPRSLLKEGESGILIVQIAPDLPTLFGPLESELLGAEPSLLVGGGQYVEVSAIVSLDNGLTYTEVDIGRFDERPIHLSIKGLDVVPGSSYLIYSHESGFVHHPTFGDRVVAWEGEWNTDAIRNLVITDAAMEADVTFLSVFAPYQAPLEGPKIALLPVDLSTQDYGFVTLGTYLDKTFTVRNVGGGVLAGTLTTTNDAFSVVSGAVFYLDPGEATRVTVRFMPTAAERYIGNAVFTGGGYATFHLCGVGYRNPSPLSCSGAPSSGAVPTPGYAIADAALMALAAAALLLLRSSVFRARGSTVDGVDEVDARLPRVPQDRLHRNRERR